MYGSEHTVKPRYNDPRFNDIPDLTMNIILCPKKICVADLLTQKNTEGVNRPYA